MPDPAQAPRDGYYRANLRSRGLAEADAAPLAERRRFHLDDQASALDWHSPESHDEWGSFRWTGPAPTSAIVLPVQMPARAEITLQVLNWFHADIAAEVSLRVNGRAVTFTSEGDGNPALRLRTVVSNDECEPGAMRIQIETSRMRCPHFVWGTADERWLGVCVNWVEVAPLETTMPPIT